MTTLNDATVRELIDEAWNFWFGTVDVDSLDYVYPYQRWFGGTWPIDVYLKQRFGWVHKLFLDTFLREQSDNRATPYDMSTGGLISQWQRVGARPSAPARGHLALVLLLDQFSRNIHRGTAHMFTTDALAVSVALEALNTPALWSTLSRPERLVVCICLEHIEDVELSRRHVQCIREMRDELPSERADLLRESDHHIHMAQSHLDILEQFGRYPYRNALLGRKTTAEEEIFLRENADVSFIKSVGLAKPIPIVAQQRIDQWRPDNHDTLGEAIPFETLEAWYNELGQ